MFKKGKKKSRNKKKRNKKKSKSNSLLYEAIKWSTVKQENESPPSRENHSLVTVGSSIFLIAGNNTEKDFCDVHRFDIYTSSWKCVSSLPDSRTGHCCVCFKNKIYLFGGRREEEYLNDIQVYNVGTNEWKELKQKNKIKGRTAFSCCEIEGIMYVFGGVRESEKFSSQSHVEYLKSLHAFDLKGKKWLNLNPRGKVPRERAGHSCCVVDKKFFIFGGRKDTYLLNDVYMYDTETSVWCQLNTYGDIPQSRVGHTLISYLNYVIVIGGFNLKSYLNDVHVLDIDSLEWSKRTTEKNTILPKGRWSHSCCRRNNKCYLFGGSTRDKCFNDMYILDLKSFEKKKETSELVSSDNKTTSPIGMRRNHSTGSFAQKGIILGKTTTRKRKKIKNLKLKIIYESQIRVFTHMEKMNHRKLIKKLSKIFNLSELSVYYYDEHQNIITVRDNQDFMECKEFFINREQIPILHLIPSISAKFVTENTISRTQSPLPNNGFSPLLDNHSFTSSSSNDDIFDLYGPRSIPSRTPSPYHSVPLWQRGELIGEGAYGKVYMGINSETSEFLAVKIIKIDEKDEMSVQTVTKEINLMKGLAHPNIVRFYGAERDQKHLYIYMEYVNGGSIASLIKKFKVLSENIVRIYTSHILKGLHYLHSKDIVHSDIKGANILVNDLGIAKLADFGSSRTISINEQSEKSGIHGTPFWMAPETINRGKTGKYNDIWSVGCTVLEMLSGIHPWKQFAKLQDKYVIINRIAATNDTPWLPNNISPAAKDFLKKCFIRDPLKRPKVDELLKHDFVTTRLTKEEIQQLFHEAQYEENRKKNEAKNSSVVYPNNGGGDGMSMTDYMSYEESFNFKTDDD